MVAGRARIIAGSVLGSLLAASLAGPVAAADCALSAPAYVNVGTELTIEGSGFPASTGVDFALSIEGGTSDAFTVQTDAAGELQIALIPEEIDVGVTTIEATAGTACSAELSYTVLAAGEVPPASIEPETPDDGGTGPSAPQTDVTDVGTGDRGANTTGWMIAITLIIIGSIGLARRPFSRR